MMKGTIQHLSLPRGGHVRSHFHNLVHCFIDALVKAHAIPKIPRQSANIPVWGILSHE